VYLLTKINTKRGGTLTNPVNIDSESAEESDGYSALREVEARESGQGARRGPANASLQHFRDPTPVLDKGRVKRWEFQCRFCTWYVSIFCSFSSH
jgi:hypothetical protein